MCNIFLWKRFAAVWTRTYCYETDHASYSFKPMNFHGFSSGFVCDYKVVLKRAIPSHLLCFLSAYLSKKVRIYFPL